MEEIFETYQNSLYPEQEEFPFLPTSVDQAYERILQKISPQQKPNARKILLIIAGAKRVLMLYDTESAVFVSWFTRFWNKLRPDYPWWNMSSQHAIAFAGHCKILKLLNECHPTEVDALDGTENTALWYAANQGHIEVVEQLLHLGATITTDRPLWYGSILQTAAENGHWNVVNSLLKHGAVDGADSSAILAMAAGMDYDELVETIMKETESLWCRKDLRNTALYIASGRSDERRVRLLLQRRTDIDALMPRGGTSLSIAVERGHRAVVQVLANAGADFITVSSRKLFTLLGEGSKIDTQDGKNSLLLWAVHHGYEDIAESMLSNGADVNAKKKYGTPTLCLAIGNRSERIVDALLHRGADIDVLNEAGETPLLMAVEKGQVQIVQKLLNRGADLNCRTRSGTPLLIRAAELGNNEVVRALLDREADVNVRLQDTTPLIMACGRRKWTTVRWLVERGADLNVINKRGLTALDSVRPGVNDELRNWLIERGAKRSIEVRALDRSDL